jgi:hypothetical protein
LLQVEFLMHLIVHIPLRIASWKTLPWADMPLPLLWATHEWNSDREWDWGYRRFGAGYLY